MRTADVGIKDGIITDVGNLSGAKREIRADGLMVIPGIIDAHTHYDPQLTFDPYATSSCFHGVTSVIGGNCGYSIAPVQKKDHDYIEALFAKVEGMSPKVLHSGLPWDWDSFPSYLDAIDKRLGINAAVYIGHSAIRRFVMGDAASERKARPDELDKMKAIVREAMHAGAAGFSSSLAPTHVDQFNKPVPSRHAEYEEVAALIEVAGEGGAGSISFLPETMVRGLDERDRERIIEVARRCGLPIIVQGMGSRAGKPEMWADQKRFLARARERGAAIFSMLRNQPFMRPFNWKRGTSLFDGVFHWRDLTDLPPAERLAKLRDPKFREQLRAGLDHPNTDGSKGSTLPPPPLHTIYVDGSKSDPGAIGKTLAQLAKERGVHASDIMAELATGDNLETQFIYNDQSDAWAQAKIESLQSPHMIVGTGDGGAHADRDDGAEWSTFFIKYWLLEKQVFTLEEGIRRITHIPAMIAGIKGRGLIARGYHADIAMFDPGRIGLGKKRLTADMPGGEERWQVGAEGITRVIVNGEVIVENGELTTARPGRVLRVGN
jgi:N-acyl-D-aspartate/D-glutamate deacylase